MTRTPVVTRRRPFLVVHDLHDRFEHEGIGSRQYAVAEVEDMAGVAPGAAQHLAGGTDAEVNARQASGRVEVALDRLVTDPSSSLVEVDAPVDATTELPAPAMRLSNSPVPTPNSMVGTSRSATPSSTVVSLGARSARTHRD